MIITLVDEYMLAELLTHYKPPEYFEDKLPGEAAAFAASGLTKHMSFAAWLIARGIGSLNGNH